jgi:hypothetical protein
MATLTPNRGQGREPRSIAWRAMRKREGRSFFLGYFATKEEAEAEEVEFDKDWPSGRYGPRC